MPYDKDNLGRIVKWKPIKDKNSLELYFVLPYTQNEYTTRPLEYYSHLIGHEGENSLLSYLKKEDLATELSSNFSSELDVFSDFSVEIRLTDNGLKNYERVL
jgi:insulysin